MGDADRFAPNRAPRLETAAGFSAILFLIAFLIQGNPPAPDEETTTIADYLRDQRSGILAGDSILAVAAVPFFWFIGVIRAHFGSAGEWRRSEAGALGMAIGTGIVLAAAAVQAGLVLNIATTPEVLVRFGFDVFNSLITIAGGLFAVGVAGFAGAGVSSGMAPRWLWRFGFATAVLQIATLPGLVVESGAFAAGGPVALSAFVVLVAWFVAATTHLMRAPGLSTRVNGRRHRS